MPLQATSGAASYDAFGGGVAAVPTYIEDVFSTYLYTGNGTSQTITNNIDLSTKGGLVWLKNRGLSQNNLLVDTARTQAYLATNNTNGNTSSTGYTLNSNGFSLTTLGNSNTYEFASWTFRKQPKFFDVVTYTGTGSVLNVSHNLGSVPGCIIIKRTSAAADWTVYHRSTGNAQATSLNTTQAASASTAFNSTTPTSTVFTLGSGGAGSAVNASGQTYVAYLFAHDAGGFGLTGTDNVISCGTYTGPGTGGTTTVTLGYEPQWVLIKRSDGVSDWSLFDNMRGMPVSTTATDARLLPNLADAEENLDVLIDPTATGFTVPYSTKIGVAASYIYIAIRRGPMKVPTDATKVFNTVNANVPSGTKLTAGLAPDAILSTNWFSGGTDRVIADRLRGVSTISTNTTSGQSLTTNSDTSESTGAADWSYAWDNVGFRQGATTAAGDNIFWAFKRAPSFFDEVCYTGTGSATTQSHNLGVAPEMMIVKSRNTAFTGWLVYHSALGNTGYINLNYDFASSTSSTAWSSTTPTSSVFSLGNFNNTNGSGRTFVAYLFATLAGVSKVGSYTGTGSTQTISCGFTGGARWVMIKRTNSTGDWYVWDTARGMVSGNDRHLFLNGTAAQVNANNVYTDTGGFQIVSTDPSINASGGNYIYLAIA